MRRGFGPVGVGLAAVMLLMPPVLFAEIVKEVSPEGVLIMEDGRKFALAGVVMDAEGASVLRVLAQKQDVRLEVLNSVKAADGGECAYAHLTAKAQSFPSGSGKTAGEEEVALNEFLIRTGSAKVDASQDFARKEKFLKLQEEARRKGEGVWSYVGS